MEESILISIKNALGIVKENTAFDEQILMHVNTVFSTLNQVGIGPDTGFFIEDDSSTWEEFIDIEDEQFNSVKSYIVQKARLLFDLPTTSYQIEAIERQIQELEFRLNLHREIEDWEAPEPEVVIVDPCI